MEKKYLVEKEYGYDCEAWSIAEKWNPDFEIINYPNVLYDYNSEVGVIDAWLTVISDNNGELSMEECFKLAREAIMEVVNEEFKKFPNRYKYDVGNLKSECIEYVVDKEKL
jgi:hypothetical protein